MNGSIRSSGRRAQHDDVRELQGVLLRHGATIAADELIDGRVGPTTRKATEEFQRARGLQPTGLVDRATADALRTLAETTTTTTYHVVGRVRWADGEPAAGVIVRAFDRDLRREQPLGEAIADERGGYHIMYTRDRFARAEKGSADLLVRVFAHTQPLNDPQLRDTWFNAPELALTNIDLSRPRHTPRSEYERIFAAVVPLLDDVPLSGLKQDRTHQDVTFLAAETGFPAAALAHFGVAQKLAATYQIPAAFFYALFAEDTLIRAGLQGTVGARFGIDLGTELLPLFYDIVLLDEATIRTAVRDAIDHGKVPDDLDGELDTILETLARKRPEAERYRADERPRELFARVQQFLVDGAHERVLSILTEDALGDLPGLFTKLSDAAVFTSPAAADEAATVVMTTTGLVDVLGYDEQIIDRIRAHRGIERPADVRRLARMNPSEWRAVLGDTTADVRVAGQPIRPEMIGRHASALARRLEARYPTTAFAAQLERDSAHRATAFGEHGDMMVTVLNASADFDLRTGNVELLLRQQPTAVDSGVRQALKTTQRVFKLIPTYRQTKALLGAGVPSAAKIHAMGETRFVTQAVGTGAFTDEQARVVYAKAADVHVASALLAGELQNAAGATKLAALQGGVGPDLEAVSADFPNLKSLFQLADACFCEECRSVHSAAAYLADTLQFLKNRLVTDDTVPGPATKAAKDVLFERRPDLGDLDLSCENTNIPVPYIDLVCELLEDAVAPDPGVTFAGPVSAGIDPVEAPSAALLTALQNEGWPFTDRALVYEPDLSGARVVRDVDIVAKLTPDATGWLIHRLRQTVGTAAELAAAPQYVNQAAYTELAASTYAFTLPYDLAHQETRSYFAQFDVSRADLMRALQLPAGPPDAAIAAEELGLSEAQRNLITTVNPGAQSQIWNTAALVPLGGISQVDNFLSRAQLDYRELEVLLGLTWVNPSDAIFIKHLDSGCDLSKKTIQNLDNPALDRLHRFLRLLRAPGMSPWTPALLDRAIRSARLGNGAIDNAFLVKLTLLPRLGLPLAEAINLYEVLDDQRYAQLFLNEGANGPIEDAFRPQNVLDNELAEATTPGTGVLLPVHEGYLATCLGITPADAGLLVADLGNTAILSFANISAVYAATLLMRTLHLTAADLLILKVLTGLDPLASPQSTVDFAGHTGSAVKPADLRYLLRHEADDLAARDLPDAKLTEILTALHAGYQSAYADTRPDVDPAAPPEENKPGLRAVLSLVPGVGAPDLAAFESIVDGKWTDPAVTAAQFVDLKLASIVDTTAIQGTIVAANPTDVQKNATILAFTDTLSAYFYLQARRELLLAEVDAARLASQPLLDILLDDDDPTVLPAQRDALRLLHVWSFLVAQLRISDQDFGWVLDNAGPLGWLAPDTLPYKTGMPPRSLPEWERLAAGLALAAQYPPVANPLDPAAPWTAYGLFELALKPGTATQVQEYLAALAGLDAATVTALHVHLGLSVADYQLPETVTRVIEACTLLRRLGLSVAEALPLIQSVSTAAEAATMRQALKARYAEAEWPGVLQIVQDRLRVGKRDALVAYLLAKNPEMRSSADLYEYFLIDVEMSPCMPTSRVVQAHATIQLFVQRCLMGLEPHSVAATTQDPSWEQWKWMANFRVWEANRKVFLYPENWIEPELRDDKSELFVELDNQLQQDELTDLAVENATIAYLEKMDDLAHLDVMACYYEHDVHVMHVVARTKGGDPAVYYYRQFQKERYWTPWSRVPLDIAGDHLLAFDRNSRLTLAWPVFTEEADTTQTSTIPDPDALDGSQETEKPRKRWRIQLAVGERAHGKWQPKKVSKDALLYPASGYYDDLPRPDEFNFFAYALGTAGQAIPCLIGDIFVGSFALTGCRGFPEPTQGGLFGGLALSPTFKETELVAERFREQKPRVSNDLAISTTLGATYQTLVAQTPGRFRVTYPMQMSLIDWIILLLQLYLSSGSGFGTYERQLSLPLGTYMPYFYGDFDRAYVIIPGFYDREAEDSAHRTEKTYSDIDQFVRDVLALLFKYLKVYLEDPQHDLQKALEALTKDPEYARLLQEFAVYQRLSYGVQFKNFYHPLVCFLRTTLNREGVPALMRRETQLRDTGFSFETTYQPDPIVVLEYPVEDIDFDSDGAYSGYNWELFFHLPFDIAMRLNRDQRFAEARDWFHYIFNPVGTGDGATAPQKYWITKPFFQTTASDYLSQRINDIMYAIAADPSGATITDLKFAVSQWREKPFRPHVIARTRPVAYQLSIVVNYIKNLVDWGDHLFRQFTRESVTQATQLYILADKLLGPKPSVVPPLVTPAVATYNQLEPKLDLFGNALLDLENLIPDLDLLPHGGAELPTPLAFSSLYFCIPPNEKLLELWDLVGDRLFKIRNCQNIDGVESILALFAPPIDPGALVRAVAGGLDISSFLAGLGAPQPNYRFRVMTQKATELVVRVGELGNALLAALEKRDAEKLARLRGDQEITLLAAVRLVKETTIAEAEGNIEALKLSKAVAKERKDYYSSRSYMNAWEITATVLGGLSLVGEAAIAVGYILSGGLKLIPELMTGGAGFGGSPTVTVTAVGPHLGESAESAVLTLASIARALDKAAGMAASQATYRRRMDDWEHQAAVADREMTQLDQQLKNAELHLAMLTQDLAAHDKEAAQAQQTKDFLHAKYTNQELYEWMVGQTSSVYFSAYKLAFDVAKKAERCFAHELGSDAVFLKPGYWDSLKKGLTAADALYHDIKRMEVAYLDQHKRERELTKHVSLAQLDPAALVQLRATGTCVVNVPEAIFDLDHPGHYFRRLKTVGLSIPCVAGPYTSVSAKLSLVSNKYRKTTAAKQGASTDKDKYMEVSGDPRFAYNIGAIESIATSTGLSDSGVFELDFADERYLPFEGKGAIGTWRIELPQKFRQFDYDTITDVVLHLRYTARDGGSTLRTMAENSLRELLNDVLVDATHSGLFQAFSVRHQFPDEWWQLQQQQSTQLTIGLDQLPFLVRGHSPVIDGVTWYARVTTDLNLYPISVGGAPAVNLNRVAELDQCVGPAGTVTLGAPFQVAADPTNLTDLVALVHYKLNS